MTTIYIILYGVFVVLLSNSCIEPEKPIWDEDVPASEDFYAHNGFWNEDGTKIYFQHVNLSEPENLIVDDIWSYDLNSEERKSIFRGRAYNGDVNQDETKFIFHKTSFPLQIFEYDVANNKEKPLTGTDSTNSFENVLLARYSPDFSKILFTIFAGEPRGISIMDTTGRNAEIIVDYGIMGGWFPSGDKVVYVNWLEGRSSKNAKQIFEADTDGSNQKVLTDIKDTDLLAGPVVSPDGTKIAFGNDAGEGNSELFLMDYKTKKSQQVTKGVGYAGAFAWSPDGSQILFSRVIPNVTTNLFLIDTQTYEVKPLFKKK
tara:strand:+ start:584 stop:1531 length:948 start_codon:yes stop_codon:yes gene_type:complete